MSTGLFELLKAVNRPELIRRFFDGASYDELYEVILDKQKFNSIYHTHNKYATPVSEGTYSELLSFVSGELIHPDEREDFAALMNPETVMQSLGKSEIPGLYSGDFRVRLVNGKWGWVELVLLAGRDYGIENNVLRIYIFDCNNRKSRELGTGYSAAVSNYDRNELTGLLRKRAFIKESERIIKNSEIKQCVVSVDIENFKLFNEWYGHSEGDLLMVQIAAALQEAAESTSGAAGYFGQDDFCLLIPYDMEHIGNLFDHICSLVNARGSSAGFLPAFGVCVVEDGITMLDLLDRSFLAVQVAKKGYHSRIRVFEKSMYRDTDKEYYVLTNFLQALKNHEIVFYLQPQCRASSGKIVGAEALARWIKPDGRIVCPDMFIPVLEKRGLICDLDLYIWEEVCRWQRKMLDEGRTVLPVSVNVSVSDILHTNLPVVFENLTSKYSLERRLIKIEITESSYISNTSIIRNTLRTLKEMGFTVLMDDFGSGYSTLNMLKNLNVDVVKLDAQFLNMDESNETKSIHILESVTNMTKTLGVPIIVEGVETKEQKDFLQDMGCRYIQGYYFYRSMPVEEYEVLISDPQKIDTSGIIFKSNQQFRLRELLDNNIYSDTMLNNILGPCALYLFHDDGVDIVRYNEQFYEAVDIPNFKDRLNCIQQYMPEGDVPLFYETLNAAERDRLNGKRGVMHFYKTDGTLTTFDMHFYYLHTEGGGKVFYGSVQNITKLSNLEKQIKLLSTMTKDTVLFMSRTPDGGMQFTVLFNGLEKDLGMSARELEAELNKNDLLERVGAENSPSALRKLTKKIQRSESFSSVLNMTNPKGEPLALEVHGNSMQGSTDVMNYYIVILKKPEK